ncbi:MAG: hypothetical protein HY964_05695 [Ignavibacteriales bacterium]|nr:hypothetical protein [Ignavibacteriales bacterium]
MLKSFKYRSAAILLAGIFSAFNIGLPIALHYCKMMETVSSNSCGMCVTDKKECKDIQISKTQSSCCKTIVAADRNQTEFLQTQKNDVTKLEHSNTPTLQFVILDESLNFTKFINLNLHSPPLFEDIPIFTSSLLI